MKGLKHGSNVGPPAGPSQKPWSHILYNLYLIHGRFVQQCTEHYNSPIVKR